MSEEEVIEAQRQVKTEEWISGEECNEECVLFRESLCDTKREDGLCDREFTPKSRLDTEECRMYYPRMRC